MDLKVTLPTMPGKYPANVGGAALFVRYESAAEYPGGGHVGTGFKKGSNTVGVALWSVVATVRFGRNNCGILILIFNCG
jgi:hypothetical protein